jgi:hypothetical protein
MACFCHRGTLARRISAGVDISLPHTQVLSAALFDHHSAGFGDDSLAEVGEYGGAPISIGRAWR